MSPIMHPGDIDQGPVAHGFPIGTRVQAVLRQPGELAAALPDMVGTVVPIAEWPSGVPEEWDESNTIIVRWDRDIRPSFSVYRPNVAARMLRVLGPVYSASHRSSSQAGLASLSPSGGAVTSTPAPSEAPAPDHGPLAATLSDTTLAKVLSRPAHVPSLVELDRREAAAEMQSARDNLVARALKWEVARGMSVAVFSAAADELADAVKAYLAAVAR